MNLTRRAVLKNLLIVSGGICVLPSCLHKEEATSIPLKNISLTKNDEQLMASIAETIIPATNTPGARDTYTHLYALKILDDCYEKEEQQKFIKGLHAINPLAKKSFEKLFSDGTAAQREALLNSIEAKKGHSDEVTSFYKIMKDLTIHGYVTSKPVMTKLILYELVPGRFRGSFPVQKNTI